MRKLQQNSNKNVLVEYRGVTSISGTYYYNNEALEYISITKDCYPDVNNIIIFSFEENIKFKNTRKEIEEINNNSTCKAMTRIYTAFYRALSGNYNPLDGIALGINIIALNA